MLVYYEVMSSPIKLWIERKSKILHISCLKTNFSKIRIAWNYLFDEGKETEQDKETENLTDEEFKKRMDEAMIRGIYDKLQRREGNSKAEWLKS